MYLRILALWCLLSIQKFLKHFTTCIIVFVKMPEWLRNQSVGYIIHYHLNGNQATILLCLFSSIQLTFQTLFQPTSSSAAYMLIPATVEVTVATCLDGNVAIYMLREYVTNFVTHFSTGKEDGFRFFFLPILIDC